MSNNNVSVQVSANTTAFNAGLAKVQSGVTAFKNHTQGQFEDLGRNLVGAFAFTAIIGSVQGLLDHFGRIQDLADRFDESAGSIQRIGEAAKLSGTDLEVVVAALQKAGNNAFKAVEGNADLAEAFTVLGGSADEFLNMSLEEKLTQLSTGFADGGANAEKLKAAMEILGKAGGELAPLLAQGPEALRAQFEAANVATDESVLKLAQAGDKIDKTFSNIRAVGATALAALIDGAETLWAALNTVGVFLANLPDGLKAATEAADQFSKEWAEARKAEETPEAKPKVDVEAIREKAEAAKKGADDEKKAADELAKIQAENAKKEEDAYMRSLSLLQKKLELERQIKEMQSFIPANELEEEKNKGKVLDIQKELEGVNKQLEQDQDRKDKEKQDKAKKAAADLAKAELEAKQDELKKAESGLSDLDRQGTAVTVDSLRQVGGGVANADYQQLAKSDDLQRQAVDLQRQTVEQLKQAVTALQNANKPNTSLGDGSFS